MTGRLSIKCIPDTWLAAISDKGGGRDPYHCNLQISVPRTFHGTCVHSVRACNSKCSNHVVISNVFNINSDKHV